VNGAQKLSMGKSVVKPLQGRSEVILHGYVVAQGIEWWNPRGRNEGTLRGTQNMKTPVGGLNGY